MDETTRQNATLLKHIAVAGERLSASRGATGAQRERVSGGRC
jgi:hypothetical protein